MTRVLVVVPAPRHCALPDDLLDRLLVGVGSAFTPEVLVVGPGARRASLERRASRLAGQLHLLPCSPREGDGRILRAGLSWAREHRHDAVVTLCAEGPAPLDRLPALAAATLEAELAICPLPRGGITRALLPARTGRRTARALAGVTARDLTHGAKAWSGTALVDLDLDRLPASGCAFQIQATLAAVRAGARVVQVPPADPDAATTGVPGSGPAPVTREAVVAIAHLRQGRPLPGRRVVRFRRTVPPAPGPEGQVAGA